MFGICNLSVIPGRAESSDKSEITTQLLLGEHFQILHREDKWLRIKHGWDNYECWISDKQYTEITEKEFKTLQAHCPPLVNEIAHVVFKVKTKSSVPLVLGSALPFFEKGNFKLGKDSYRYEGAVQTTEKRFTRVNILETAFLYLHAPYLWGGKTPFGIDCSGFTQMVFKMNGTRLPRDAWQQAALGAGISFVEEAQPGDLAFFDNAAGRIIHVGIILPESRIIHASGKVRIDKLDHHGIYNQENGKYTHNLRIIKNYFVS